MIVSVLEKMSAGVNHWIEYLLFGMGFSMALLVATQVFFRYVLNQSLFWSEELARYLLVWLTFLGASAAYYRHAHPGVDILYRRMTPGLRKVCLVLIHLVSISLFVVMIVYGYRFAHFVQLQTTPALQLPKWIVLSIIPISGAVLLIHGITFLVDALQRSRP
ncbi:TRAP transporter small permease [Desulfosarcina ovata]|uniref:C4-dicarboxylate ABC transporter substrate-binding protein n=2 Tax=Desulfosarcina ovata TaxID=83564 RepID=A0A5K8AKV5_9BACT|nr:TRAP transporter small permease [Desulfosarcina ovata]BBO86411.1 C4-dicarboxylate ABC transporter substrate-binding protein [Desulfosarcina ovata subsp. sediminis]BBO93355.1 C4-dicarboxylate ABC transporter substrate-binding protein [Desulfosarcina ovata subsp. ovata]